jgi:hypothetical protein
MTSCNDLSQTAKETHKNIEDEVLCTCSVEDYNKASEAAKAPNGVATYFFESDICASARHMNVLNSDQATIVDLLPGSECNYFEGAPLNGVTSIEKELSANDHTYYFKGKGNGNCNQKTVNVSCAETSKSWTVGGKDCSGTIEAYSGVNGGSKTVTDSEGNVTGTASFKCTNNAWESAALEGATCTQATADTTPDAFSFTAKLKQPINTLVTSGTITVTGINAAAAISITGGSYKIDSGAWTKTAGQVNDGQKVVVSHVTSGSFETEVKTTLTIGGVNGEFKSKTDAKDVMPDDPFKFDAKIGVNLNTVVTSGSIVIKGINAAAKIKVLGGSYRINTGAWTTADGTVKLNDKVYVSHKSSSEFNKSVTTILYVGGDAAVKPAEFKSTTAVEDTRPKAFSFGEKKDQDVNVTVTSGSIIISEINSKATISIKDGEYKINSGAWTSATQTDKVANGDKIWVRNTSNSLYGSKEKLTTLIVGGVEGTFKSITKAVDSMPDNNYNMPTKTNQAKNAFVSPAYVQSSATVGQITLTGFHLNLDTDIKISVDVATNTTAQYRIKRYRATSYGAWTSAAGKVNNGDQVQVQMKINAYDTQRILKLSIGATATGLLEKTFTMKTKKP